MTTDEYQLVIDWDSWGKMAAALGLKLVIDKTTRAVNVHQGSASTVPIAYLTMERVYSWLDGYRNACEIIEAAQNPRPEESS